MSVERDNWMKLSPCRVRWLFIYYTLLLLFGLAISILSLDDTTRTRVFTDSIFTAALMGSIGISLVGSSSHYIRKLYKSCIQKAIQEPTKDDIMDLLQQLGVFMYFMIRPIFAIGFALLVAIALKSGIAVVTKSTDNESVGFIYLTMFFSFFAGFSSGDLLKTLENYGKSVFDKLFSNNSEGSHND